MNESPLHKVIVRLDPATRAHCTDLLFVFEGRHYATRVNYAVPPGEYRREAQAFLERRRKAALAAKGAAP